MRCASWLRLLSLLPAFIHAWTHLPGTKAATVPSLYHSTFKKIGLTHWIAQTPGWRISSGTLAFDGNTSSEILAPVTTTGLHDFAVEAKIQSLGATGAQAEGYGLVVRRGVKPTSGIRAGMGLSIPEQATEPQLMWSNDGAGGSLVRLQPGFNTFRIDVHGADYDLTIDGVDAVHLRIDSVRKRPGIGIWSGGYALRVKTFRVLTLAPTTAPTRLPSVKSLDLQLADLPIGLQRVFGHYWTNDEYARANLIPLADVLAGGRLITYESGYLSPARSGFYAVSGFVAAFKSAGDASTAFAAMRIPFTGLEKFTRTAVPDLGPDAYRASFEFQDNNGPIADVDGIFFDSRRFVVLLYGDFSLDVSSGVQAEQMLAMAKNVQGRILAPALHR